MLKKAAKLAAAVVLVTSPAAAQSEAEIIDAFAGDWQIIDSRYSSGAQPCQLSLQRERQQEQYLLEKENCGGDLAGVSGWSIDDGQMSLLDGSGTALARLGGNQRRMSGNTSSGSPVILERVGASSMADALQSARRASGCIYSGFTDKCASEEDLAGPTAGPGRIEVLVNLNVRAEARADAAIIGVIPANTCISTETCVKATDGAWCRARFDGRTGWMRKLALRQNRWPVITFLNQCSN